APNRSAQSRDGRAGTNPGEIITRPDTSERWIDRLLVGQAAPEFTLPLAASPGNRAISSAAKPVNAPSNQTGSPPRVGGKNDTSGSADGTHTHAPPKNITSHY